MEKIPTIEEYFKTEFEIWEAEYPELKTATHRKLIEFIQLHMRAAKEEIAKQALVHQTCNHYHSGTKMWEDKSGEVYITVRNENSYDEHHCITVDKDSILNSYPETNIQ